MANPWFRFYPEAITDLKVEAACELTQQPKVVIVGALAILLSLANNSPVPGQLSVTVTFHVTVERVTRIFGLELEPTKRIISTFVDLGILSQCDGIYSVVKWKSRQFSSDSSAERMRKLREKRNGDGQPPSQPPSHERHGDGPEAEPYTEADTEEKSEEGAGAPPSAGSSAKPSAPINKSAPPDDSLLINLTSGGLTLLAKYEQLASSKGRTGKLRRYTNEQQRKAYEAVFSKLNGELEALIDKGFAHDRTTVSGLLSWLEGCVKRNESEGGRAAGRPAQPTREQDHAAIDEAFRSINGGQ